MSLPLHPGGVEWNPIHHGSAQKLRRFYRHHSVRSLFDAFFPLRDMDFFIGNDTSLVGPLAEMGCRFLVSQFRNRVGVGVPVQERCGSNFLQALGDMDGIS